MPDYSLQLKIGKTDLDNIRTAQLNIVLAKPVGSSSPNVAWQVFDPFMDNTVTWTEQFGLYASNTRLVNGARITKMSTIDPAVDAAYYSFTSNATFNGPIKDGNAPGTGSYMVLDDMPNASYPTLLFGLLQSANINGAPSPLRPLNAAIVLASMSAVFTPLTTVYVWLQATIVSETVITQVTSRSTVVTFGGSVTSQVLIFDGSKGMFVPAAPKGLSVAEGKEHELDESYENVKLLTPAFY